MHMLHRNPFAMPFAIEISEVGPAEYPLLEVLRDTVFGEFGHVSTTPVATALADHQDLLVLIAHLEGNPLGFSAGFRRKPKVYYINFLAILRDYRRQGVGREFMQRHESFARAAGYRYIEFNTFNHFPSMQRLGLSLGYRPVGLEQHDATDQDLAIRFGRTLLAEGPSASDIAETNRVRAALEEGQQIVGLLREQTGGLQTILRSAERSREGTRS
jgi:GNAT superfamily N-acetyltransferase